jgi:predicted AAA+ superfamily ATPase
LALQLGSEVSLNELGNTLDLDTKTVASYLDILEKLCIIFPLKPFFSNKRKSISKLKKYYFYDLGVRNVVIDDFASIESRKDFGALWENFCIMERMKRNDTAGRLVNYYFWRSYQNEEVDLIEVENENMYGFEFKRKEQTLDKKIKEIYRQDLAGKGDLEVVYPGNFRNFGI